METLIDPNAEQFSAAVQKVSYGVADNWVDTAFRACWLFVGGHVATSPYGEHNQTFVVRWQWTNGTLTVTMYRD